LANKADGAKLWVNHSAPCHGQMSTAYKPAFMYIHWMKSAHTKKKKKKSWSVVFTVEKFTLTENGNNQRWAGIIF
jgi:hypothetical protein